MEKIAKLEEFNWVSGRDAITIALCNTIIGKQNEIIDYLNSQDQEENEPEKVYVDPIVPDFIAEKLAEERYNTREILLNGTKPLEVEDTPEEWEKELRKRWYLWTYNKELDQYITCENEVIDFIQAELDRAREEGRKELLDSIIEGVTQLKDLVSMFNPMSPEIRAKQSGEIEAYNGLLEKLSKLTTK